MAAAATPTPAPTMPAFHVAAGERVLHATFGHGAFRGRQAEAIGAVLDGRDCLYVAATGAGKSLVYQYPTQFLHSAEGAKAGRRSTTLVISPLLSLMEDQAMAMRAAGVSVVTLHGETVNATADWEKAMAGEYDLIFTTPESAVSRLGSLKQLHARGLLDLIAVDEAHTVSEWGVDFRPDLRRLRELRGALPGVPILALTATATPRVRDDICNVLGLVNPLRVVSSFDRPNLTYTVVMK